jgi:hypothetical protein
MMRAGNIVALEGDRLQVYIDGETESAIAESLRYAQFVEYRRSLLTAGQHFEPLVECPVSRRRIISIIGGIVFVGIIGVVPLAVKLYLSILVI